MDSTPGSVDESGELERLRKRAYGPAADIAQDAAAQARLSELEAARRLPVTPGDLIATTPPETRRPGHAAADPRQMPNEDPAPEHVEGSRSAAASIGEPVPRSTTTKPWWRRRRWLATLGGAIAALVLVAAVISSVSPRPDYVLHVKGVAGDEQEVIDMRGSLSWLGLDTDELLNYEDFRGFRVWSGPTRYGTDCLIVSRFDQGPAAVGCSPSGLSTIADLQRYSGVTDDIFADMPTGSIIRFVLNGDHVDVFLGAANPITS